MEVLLISAGLFAILLLIIDYGMRFLDEQLRHRTGTKYKTGDPDER
jgi:hypothetical protein